MRRSRIVNEEIWGNLVKLKFKSCADWQYVRLIDHFMKPGVRTSADTSQGEKTNHLYMQGSNECEIWINLGKNDVQIYDLSIGIRDPKVPEYAIERIPLGIEIYNKKDKRVYRGDLLAVIGGSVTKYFVKP